MAEGFEYLAILGDCVGSCPALETRVDNTDDHSARADSTNIADLSDQVPVVPALESMHSDRDRAWSKVAKFKNAPPSSWLIEGLVAGGGGLARFLAGKVGLCWRGGVG